VSNSKVLRACSVWPLLVAWIIALATPTAQAQIAPESLLVPAPYGLPVTTVPNDIAINPVEPWMGFAQQTDLPSVPDSPTSQERDKLIDGRLEKIEKELAQAAEAEKKKKASDALKPLVRPRGRLHTDANWFSQSPLNRETVGDIEDGVFFRRARLGFDARFFDVTDLRLDFEMGARGRPNLFDAYGNISELPVVGHFRMGHFREPFSLEAQTSSNWYTFIERALNTVFDPSRNWGVMLYNNNEAETLTWWIGAFRANTNDWGADVTDKGGRAVTGRVTWLPYYDEADEGRHFWEVGGSFSYRDPNFLIENGSQKVNKSTVVYPVFPLNYLYEEKVATVPPLINIVIPNASAVQLFGFETTRNFGPLNLQSEYIASRVERNDASTVLFGGVYVQASYWLTGESRRWNRLLGSFGEAQVFSPFLRPDKGSQAGRGWGAWEATLRWSDLNLNSKDLQGGYLDATTAGLNWYLNPYVRFMFNYSLNNLDNPEKGRSDLNVFNTRFDLHF
jgi:phosphate-selective porin OprO/OprP